MVTSTKTSLNDLINYKDYQNSELISKRLFESFKILVEAARRNNFALFKKTVENNPELLRKHFRDDYYAITIYAKYNRIEMLEYIVNKMDLNKDELRNDEKNILINALRAAAENGHPNTVEFLLTHTKIQELINEKAVAIGEKADEFKCYSLLHWLLIKEFPSKKADKIFPILIANGADIFTCCVLSTFNEFDTQLPYSYCDRESLIDDLINHNLKYSSKIEINDFLKYIEEGLELNRNTLTIKDFERWINKINSLIDGLNQSTSLNIIKKFILTKLKKIINKKIDDTANLDFKYHQKFSFIHTMTQKFTIPKILENEDIDNVASSSMQETNLINNDIYNQNEYNYEVKSTKASLGDLFKYYDRDYERLASLRLLNPFQELINCVRENDYTRFREIIKNYPQIMSEESYCKDGYYTITILAKYGRTKMLKYLLNEINLDFINIKRTKEGDSVSGILINTLRAAAENGFPGAVRLLLQQQKIKVLINNNKLIINHYECYSLLHWLLIKEFPKENANQIFAILISSGADILTDSLYVRRSGNNSFQYSKKSSLIDDIINHTLQPNPKFQIQTICQYFKEGLELGRGNLSTNILAIWFKKIISLLDQQDELSGFNILKSYFLVQLKEIVSREINLGIKHRPIQNINFSSVRILTQHK